LQLKPATSSWATSNERSTLRCLPDPRRKVWCQGLHLPRLSPCWQSTPPRCRRSRYSTAHSAHQYGSHSTRRARRWCYQRPQGANRGRLPRTVGPEEPEYLALCHRERDVLERDALAEAFGEVVNH
jgi:hypothetical protein